MANITIYIAPALVAELRRLRAKLKREKSSLSRWFDEQVREAGRPRYKSTNKET